VHLAVRTSAYCVGQLEGELHDGCNSRKGRKRQPARLRATKLQNTNYRGGRQDFAETRSRGNCSPYVIVTFELLRNYVPNGRLPRPNSDQLAIQYLNRRSPRLTGIKIDRKTLSTS